MKQISITRPDDWHIHLRDGASLEQTVKDVSRYFGRAIVMPNLLPPVTDTSAALAYRDRISVAQKSVAPASQFQPLMTLYLTDNTRPQEIELAQQSGHIHAVKLYPAGATTNSDSGVSDIKNIYPVLETLQKTGMPLLLHGEVTDQQFDIFDREKLFLEQQLTSIVRDFPDLRIVLEHITTEDAADFVREASDNIAATITAHHLLYNRNHMLAGGIRPHYYCLPILKRSSHQQALINAATSGNNKFFLGTDSAPHVQGKKETACGCAGCYSAHAAIELYAEVFEQADALDKLEGFASFYGADFYRLPRNSDSITLIKENWQVESHLPFNNEQVVPLRAGETMQWRVIV